MWGFGFSMGWLGMIVQLLLIVGVIYFLVSLLGRGRMAQSENSEAILRERFARGMMGNSN